MFERRRKGFIQFVENINFFTDIIFYVSILFMHNGPKNAKLSLLYAF